ncbi:MAG: acylphosphatase [Bacteroidales bacterium]|nr:acylphosphatase [Bacteroidales bacterium]
MKDLKAYSIRIYGRVFNVGFRRYVHRYALQCNVVGYVENDHDDGCVHIEAEGAEDDLVRFSILCGEGTPYSKVVDIKIETKGPSESYSDFEEIR